MAEIDLDKLENGLAGWDDPLEIAEDGYTVRVTAGNEHFPGVRFAVFFFDKLASHFVDAFRAFPELIRLARPSTDRERYWSEMAQRLGAQVASLRAEAAALRADLETRETEARGELKEIEAALEEHIPTADDETWVDAIAMCGAALEVQNHAIDVWMERAMTAEAERDALRPALLNACGLARDFTPESCDAYHAQIDTWQSLATVPAPAGAEAP